MHWIWFIVMSLMILKLILNYSKIAGLKEKLRLKELSFKKLKDENHDLFMRLESFDEKNIVTTPKPRATTGVDWETAQYLQERKIESKYFHPKKDVTDTSNFFYGKKGVITGVYKKFEDRNDLAKLFWEAGADIDTQVSKTTEFLIVGTDYGPSKTAKALEFGVEMIDQGRLPNYFNLN